MTTQETSSVPAASLAAIKAMSKDEAVATLKTVLRAAIKLEMATIPIYLYTYYSICRKPGIDLPATNAQKPVPAIESFPDKSSLYGNQAGAVIMSVAVEEMLHLSLAMNLLTSMLDKQETLPQIYDELTFGPKGGIILPDLSTLEMPKKTKLNRPIMLPIGGTRQSVEKITGEPLEIPLDKLSLEQIDHFMRIEYPGQKNSVSQDVILKKPEWATIGEVYSYAKALIRHIQAVDPSGYNAIFQKNLQGQIGGDNYSGSNIDTLSSGSQTFNYTTPPPADANNPESAAAVAKFENDDDHDHVGEGSEALIRVWTAQDAIDAINTICEQGEGADFTGFVDDSHAEESHYYKFWSLSAQLDGYSFTGVAPQVEGMTPPPVSSSPLTEKDLTDRFVYSVPKNPKTSDYSEAARALVDVANGLFQYMLIMTETTLLVPVEHQKLYFNKAMHQSMIWVMDKLYQDLRKIDDRGRLLAPTFENPFPAGTTRETAFQALKQLVADCEYKSKNLYNFSKASWILPDIIALPDVSVFWDGNTGVTPSTLPSFLDEPAETSISPDPRKAGPGAEVEKIDKIDSPFYGDPLFPGTPPTNAALDAHAGMGNWVRHACMGLNSCKNQGRTLNNDCSGQGWCSTALAYNAANPSQPKVSDHMCHVQNDCRGQGGCGLYGTEEEVATPGGNACQALGSCATPINAERFITESEELRASSVWRQARSHFEGKFSGSVEDLGDSPSDVGPRIEWIEASGQGMTACGSSGMSGAGSCA
ncbi:MAG: ferritin-like domain-containing protein [Litorimonas sp.]